MQQVADGGGEGGYPRLKSVTPVTEHSSRRPKTNLNANKSQRSTYSIRYEIPRPGNIAMFIFRGGALASLVLDRDFMGVSSSLVC